MGCAMGLVKLTLFIFNLIFALSGLGLIFLGVNYNMKMSEYSQFVGALGVAPIALIVVGAIVFIIAFFGCCGAIRENHCMVVTYTVLLATVFLIEVALGVYLYLHADGRNVETTIETEVSNVIRKYKTDPAAAKAVDALQISLQCCGADGPGDYSSIIEKILGEASVPASCCKVPERKCSGEGENFWQDGCVTKIARFSRDNSELIGIAVIAAAVIEIFGIIFSLCLGNSIRNADRRMGV